MTVPGGVPGSGLGYDDIPKWKGSGHRLPFHLDVFGSGHRLPKMILDAFQCPFGGHHGINI